MANETVNELVPASKSDDKDVDKRDTPKFWQRWTTLAKRGASLHWKDSARAWREDNAVGNNANRNGDGNRQWDGTGGDQWQGARYPIWWSSNQIMRSAFWSRTPETYARRVFGIDDPIALTQAEILDRLGRYGIDTGEYDCAMKDCVADWLNADKTTTQVCASYKPVKTKNTRQAVPGATPDEYLDAETQQPVLDEIKMDPATQQYFYEQTLDEIEAEKIYAKSVPYNHILHTPSAKNSYEITDMGYYFCFTKEQAIDQFGEATVKDWPDAVWKHARTMDREEETRERNSTEESIDQIIEGWECWSKITKKVYWFCPASPTDFLKPPTLDPLHLKGFFPSPKFAIGSKPNDSLYPTPPFVRMWPTIDILHVMYGRVFNMIDAARRRAIVNGDDDFVAALNDLGDSEFIAAQNLTGLIENPGLENLIKYIDVTELVNCIGELNQQDEKFKANYDEWRGIPEILRGQSDPIETAAAVEQKVSSAHDRFKTDKAMFAELARETLEIMIDMYLYLYSDEKIMAVVGFKYMDPKHQQNFAEALHGLRNDEERTIRIEIETDTTSYLGEQIRIQQRNAAITTVIEGLAKVQPLLQESPEGGALALKVMQSSLEGSGAGRQFVDDITGYIDSYIEKLKQPPPPPGPDYEAMKIQIAQTNADTARSKVDVDAMKAQNDALVKNQEQMRKDFTAQLAQQKQEWEQFIQNNYLQLDATKTVGEMENKDADNSRLGVEAQAKVIEAMKPNAPETPAQPATVIINQAAPSPVPETPPTLLDLLR